MSDLRWWRAGLPAALRILPLLVAAVSTTAAGYASDLTVAPTALDPANPFAAPSTLPYQLPPFDRLHDGDFMPAYTAGMAEQLREVRAITSNPEPASFENTSLALEKSGRLLERVSRAFNSLNASHGNETTQKIEADLAPRLAAHGDAIDLDMALFRRVDDLYQRRSTLGLDGESLALLERQHLDLLRTGAMLPESAKAQLRQYHAEISTLAAQCGQNLLKVAREPAVLAHCARHYQTGAPLPPALLQRILAAQNFNQGYATAEKITASAIDLAAVPPRDTGQWLHAHGGLTRVNGQVPRDKVLSRDRTQSPQRLFEQFYGHPPDAGPLLEYHGLKPSAH